MVEVFHQKLVILLAFFKQYFSYPVGIQSRNDDGCRKHDNKA